ncbi:MAG TPA: DUF3892 domain-containing protein [Mycobacteriales bacterium]|nr:DUF3892 domain-containing protein [Mycobacteriales bacterium]
MADYQIVCTRKSATSRGHHHIVAVGLWASGSTSVYSVPQIYTFMNQRNTFYCMSPTTNRRANVEPWHCCGVDTLRSRTDGIVDNNLDSLNPCG